MIKINTRLVILILLVVSMLIISGCRMATSIEDVKNSDKVGEKVTVSGTVQNTLKIGELSGYTINDTTSSISVSSQILPKEGTKIRVTGILSKDMLFGYYIQAD